MSPGLENVEGEGIDDGQLRVYIAGPYTKGAWGNNIANAIEEAQMVYEYGHIPFIPHTMTALWSMIYQNEWIKFDLKWLEVCDAMIRIPGDSPGSDTEVEFAMNNGIPVYETSYELVENEGFGEVVTE